jgi:hypothetical protein
MYHVQDLWRFVPSFLFGKLSSWCFSHATNSLSVFTTTTTVPFYSVSQMRRLYFTVPLSAAYSLPHNNATMQAIQEKTRNKHADKCTYQVVLSYGALSLSHTYTHKYTHTNTHTHSLSLSLWCVCILFGMLTCALEFVCAFLQYSIP